MICAELIIEVTEWGTYSCEQSWIAISENFQFTLNPLWCSNVKGSDFKTSCLGCWMSSKLSQCSLGSFNIRMFFSVHKKELHLIAWFGIIWMGFLVISISVSAHNPYVAGLWFGLRLYFVCTLTRRAWVRSSLATSAVLCKFFHHFITPRSS